MKFYQATQTGMDGVKEVFDKIGISGTVLGNTFLAKKWNVTLTVGTDGIIHISSSDGKLGLDNSFIQVNNMADKPYCYAIMTDNYLIIRSSTNDVKPIILINTAKGTHAMSVRNDGGDPITVSCTFNPDGKRASEGSDARENEMRGIVTGNLSMITNVATGKAILYPYVLRGLYASEDVFVVSDLYAIYSNVVKVGALFTVDNNQYEAVQIGASTYGYSTIYYFAVPYQS